MPVSGYPFDNANTTEAQYALLAREWQDSGVIGVYGDTKLKVSADSSGMHVFVAPGAAILRGGRIASTAIEELDIDPADPQPRIDAVVAHQDPAGNLSDLRVLKGTPAVTPVRPALEQTDTENFDLLLADVAVGAGVVTIADANVTDRRVWIGGRIRVWDTASRPASPRPYVDMGFNMTVGGWEYHNGTTWVTLVPSTVDNAVRWGGYEIVVSPTTPPGPPAANRIWIQPI